MSDRLLIAERFADPTQHKKGNCFAGFDGTTDELLKVVAYREGVTEYKPMNNMEQLGQLIVDAAGKSCNVEIVPTQRKIGGNGPILTNALLEGGHAITFCGPVGSPDAIEPIFHPMTDRCQRVIALGPSSYTQALEFDNGKVMLGKLASLHTISWDALLAAISLDELIAIHDALDLFVSGNWTMIPRLHEVWLGFLKEVAPKLSPKERWMFVDLSDPAKRSDAALVEALDLLRSLNATYRVVLGLNEAEATRVAAAVGASCTGSDAASLCHTAKSLFEQTGLSQIVVHASIHAAVACDEGVFDCDGMAIPKPKVSTGAGDNFNAGYCNGILNHLSPRQCLVSGVATSASYMLYGHSPTMNELASFLHRWHNNEPL